MYSNKKYSLEQFKQDYAASKKDGNDLDAFGIFRIEDNERIPIGVSYQYDNAINMANIDCKETEGRFKDYIIEGINWLSNKIIYKFTIEFVGDIYKYYRKNAKPQIIMDDSAERLMRKQKKKQEETRKEWEAQERWYDEID